MLLSEKLVIAVAGWVLFAYLLSWNSLLEVFVVLILIGVLIIRELTDSFTFAYIKERINLFINVGIVIFTLIVIYHIISIVWK